VVISQGIEKDIVSSQLVPVAYTALLLARVYFANGISKALNDLRRLNLIILQIITIL
jgi:hypothetical protein